MSVIAITRLPAPSLADCELSFVAREPIDIERARAQHAQYRCVLAKLGCDVRMLPMQSSMPDSVFVEDCAVVLDEIAVLTRPGAPSRRVESESIATALAEFRPLASIQSPGTLDGGDVLRIGRTLYVGASARSNAEGIAQLGALLGPHGYVVQSVATRECLHLKSAVTQIDDDAVLLQPAWVDRGVFSHLRVIEVDPDEEHAANVVRVNDQLLMPDGFPRTRQRLLDAGFSVTTVPMSELQKAEGAVSCCSLLFRDLSV